MTVLYTVELTFSKLIPTTLFPCHHIDKKATNSHSQIPGPLMIIGDAVIANEMKAKGS